MKILILILLMLNVGSISGQDKKVDPLSIGVSAPDFDLPGVDGRNYTLDDFKQYSNLVVIFTCNHCPTAQAYEEKIIDMVSQYRPQGVGFVAISPNSPTALSLAELGYSDLGDNLEEMKIRSKNMGYNFPYLYDGDDHKYSLAYGPVATPHAFVFDQSRKLVYRGRIDDTENPYLAPKETDLINALDALLKKQSPPVATTKTFGCSVKWSWKDEWTKKLLKDWAEAPVGLEDIDLDGIGDLFKNGGEKYRLINVWATWCGPCVIEFPDFVEIDRMYRDRNFEFVSVSADRPSAKEKALSFLKKKEAANQNYIFAGDIYEMIEVVDPEWQGSLPYTAFIAPDGEVIYKVEGAIDPLALKQTIVEKLGRYYADNK